MLNSYKRKFLFQATGVISLTLFANINNVFAEWQASLFEHKTFDELLKSLTQDSAITKSEDILIKAPEIAENGAVVPITVNTSIPDVTSIAILVDNNPSPLTSSFDFNPQLEAYVSTRVKIAESSNITALVTTKDKQYFTASKNIKVTIGGCGG